jgi:serine/threonine protein kinase
LLRRRKTLSEPEVRFYIRQLVDGLMYLHANLVIHRDLKLGNLFLTSDMRLKIGDFGLAARLDDPNDRKTTMCGTPNYIAPEILRGTRGEGHSFEVDVWSMGVVMYTLLVGRPPFETDDVKDTYKRIRALQYAFPEDTRVSPSAQSLIRGILRTDPYQRPSLSDILQHPFFADEPMPTSLPSTALLVTPPPVMKTREPMTAPVSGALRVPVHPQAPTASSTVARRYPLRHRDMDTRTAPAPASTRDDRNLLQQRASDPGVPDRRHIGDSTGGRSSEYAAGTTSRRTFTGSSSHRGSARATEVTKRAVIDLTNDAAIKSGSSSTTASSTASSVGGDVDIPRTAMEATYRALSQLFVLQEDSGDKLSGLSSASAIVSAAGQAKELRAEAEAFLAGSSPEPASLWVLQWVDYTSKYGIGYLLSNQCAGVYFNDSTKMIAEADGRAFDYIERAATVDTAPVRTRCSMERFDKSMGKKVTLLGHFRGYLVDSHAENEEVQTLERQLTLAHGAGESMQADEQLVFVQKWVKTRHAVLFQLSNGSFQFNFFDTSKLVLSAGGRVASFLDREGSLSAWASSVAVLTPERPDLAKRLKYARDMLQQMVKPN